MGPEISSLSLCAAVLGLRSCLRSSFIIVCERLSSFFAPGGGGAAFETYRYCPFRRCLCGSATLCQDSGEARGLTFCPSQAVVDPVSSLLWLWSAVSMAQRETHYVSWVIFLPEVFTPRRGCFMLTARFSTTLLVVAFACCFLDLTSVLAGQ